MKYYYFDSHENRKLVFECEADNIYKAHLIFKEKTGADYHKIPYVFVREPPDGIVIKDGMVYSK